MNILAHCKTDKGICKKVNQDSVSIQINPTVGQEAVFAVVCDGVGGLQEGEMASASTVRVLTEWFQYEYPQLERLDEEIVRNRMLKILQNHNEALFSYSRAKGMRLGTTATIMLITEKEYYIVQIGDSRAYEIGPQRAVQLTEDQSLVAQEVRNGILTEEEARTDARRNVILQSVGSAKILEPVFYVGKTDCQAVYLLCSDGFIHEISGGELQSSFNGRVIGSKEELQLRTEYWVEEVKRRGEKDNISVAVVKYSMDCNSADRSVHLLHRP